MASGVTHHALDEDNKDRVALLAHQRQGSWCGPRHTASFRRNARAHPDLLPGTVWATLSLLWFEKVHVVAK